MNIRKQVGGSLLISILSLERTLLPTLVKTLGLSVLLSQSSFRRSLANCQKNIKKESAVGWIYDPTRQNCSIDGLQSSLDSKAETRCSNYRANRWTAYKQQEFNQVDFLAVCLLRLVFQLLLIWSGKWRCINHRLQKKDRGATPQMEMYQSPPPFIPTWGEGVTKKNTQQKDEDYYQEKTQLIQLNSHTRTNIVKFHKYILLSNQDLIQWGKYLGIPMNNVLSRD